MSLQELLNSLRELQTLLFSPSVQAFFESQPAEERKKFVAFRQEISLLVGKLTNAQLSQIADQLDLLSTDLQAGLKKMKNDLAQLSNAVSILNTLSSVLGLVARIAVLV